MPVEFHSALYESLGCDLNPLVYQVARPARAVTPDTPFEVVAEVLRVSPYRVVPVVASASSDQLIGVITETRLAHALLAAQTLEARARVRRKRADSLVESPAYLAAPEMRADTLAPLFDLAQTDTLPVVDRDNNFMGLVARSDLVQDLTRPFRPPTIGGMATPAGVYLTTGGVSGGVGVFALFATGLLFFGAQLASLLALRPFEPYLAGLPISLRVVLADFLPTLAHTALFLSLIRFSPISGYHAAEHQVVHAIERAEPLLVENVRAMPRVHPRCGTNLVAGVLLFSLVVSALSSFAGEWAYVVAGLLALAYWRTLGAFLQQYVTTRPATDAQIQSGIRAACEVLHRHSFVPYATAPPYARVWRMGFVQILTGFLGGAALLWAIAQMSPAANAFLAPVLRELLS